MQPTQTGHPWASNVHPLLQTIHGGNVGQHVRHITYINLTPSIKKTLPLKPSDVFQSLIHLIFSTLHPTSTSSERVSIWHYLIHGVGKHRKYRHTPYLEKPSATDEALQDEGTERGLGLGAQSLQRFCCGRFGFVDCRMQGLHGLHDCQILIHLGL